MHFAWMATGQTDVPGGKLAVVTDSLTFHDPHCRSPLCHRRPPPCLLSINKNDRGHVRNHSKGEKGSRKSRERERKRKIKVKGRTKLFLGCDTMGVGSNNATRHSTRPILPASTDGDKRKGSSTTNRYYRCPPIILMRRVT